MTLWHASIDLLLTAELTSATSRKNLRPEQEAAQDAVREAAHDVLETGMVGLGLGYRGTWDTDG